MSSGNFPDRLKYSIAVPLFKKGNITDPANYRPISMLTSLAKVLEMATYMRLTEHISLNNLMTDQQYGFKKGYSTEEAIFRFIYEVLNALNDKSPVGSIFFDLQKAFDSVNHSLLIEKLPYYGIAGKAQMLIKSYLSNRYQRVLLKTSRTNSNVVSEWTKVYYGVPQGSVLGPLLFLLYINDVPKVLPAKIIPILFADDTSIAITRPNIGELQQALTASFHHLNGWFCENFLSLNFNKTYFLQFLNKNYNNSYTSITLDNTPVTKTNQNFWG